MFRQGGQPVARPPTTLSKMYLSNSHATSAPSSIVFEPSVQINGYDGLGSTAKGIMIGILAVLSAAGFLLIIAAIVYYFRYTQHGRIFLDRLTRPGEYDDEQQFAKEEAEALEEMDDIPKTEYLRAKGVYTQVCRVCLCNRLLRQRTDLSQLSSRQIPPSQCKPTSPYRSSWPSRKRAFQLGNSNRN
jgi:hypothetical protein